MSSFCAVDRCAEKSPCPVHSGASNPFAHVKSTLKVGDASFEYFSIPALKDPRVKKLPYSIRVLLECALRNADNFEITENDVETILNWEQASQQDKEIPFKPARVLLQDFTGVPAVVDLAAMREAMKRLGGDPNKINPLVPAELVIDHSVQVDHFRDPDAVKKNLDIEMHRNSERFKFLKWGQKAFKNFRVVPPGSGIVHQVNLEYLARVVFNNNGTLYPDSVVGTDSHTTMINGLGVTGWGVGGIEAEAVMMGTAISMLLPKVVGYKLTGKMPPAITATDLVLTVTANLRKKGVVGDFVEFFGPGLAELSLADRATIANMSPEYGATMGFFPVDKRTMEYMKNTNRSPEACAYTEAYLRAQGMFVDHDEKSEDEIVYSSCLELDLSTLVPCVSGPKRPHDRVPVSDLKRDWTAGLTAPVSFKGFGISADAVNTSAQFDYNGKNYSITHGSVVLAAITSCTNTSNPSVLIGAGLVAKAALEKGLMVQPYIKTSLAPGSGVVTQYLTKSGLLPHLEALGFGIVGFGCTSCIGNSGDLPAPVEEALRNVDLVASAVLSGNRNFEGRVHPLTRANYLASPPLVVAYALAGTMNIDFDTEPIGQGKDGPVFLKDIWPTNDQVQKVVSESVLCDMFQEVYSSIERGTDAWNALKVEESVMYEWEEKSTYIHHPPFFQNMGLELDKIENIDGAYCLLNLGDSITTDHISPAGNITKSSPAGRFLLEAGVPQNEFNTYGARRGNDLVMARGTFANTRILNKLVNNKPGPMTMHIPSGEVMATYDAAAKYMAAGHSCVILGGAMYGNGSSRDWAAKGPYLQGVRAVIAKSFERIHRSNLVGMGILPLVFKEGEDADTLGLTGHERFSIDLIANPLTLGCMVTVKANDKTFQVKSRVDTAVELKYIANGGILQTVIRKLL